MLKLINLEKSYGNIKAVKGINITVEKGQIYGLLGPNGAGKSTTMSIICGLIKPERGTVSVGGYDIVKESKNAKKLIGIVPQDLALYPSLSARENLKFWGIVNGISTKDINKAVNRALELVGLTDRAQDRVSKYSGGMKRRLNIASGLIHNPELLIMDEPTVGIDPQSRNHIIETIKSLNNKGMTILYTSHYVEEVEDICDRVAIIDKGKVIAEGTVAELLKSESYEELIIKCSKWSKQVDESIKSLPDIEQAITQDEKIIIITKNADKLLPKALNTIIGCDVSVSEIKIVKPNLEGLFLKLTGKALRD